MLSKDVAIVNGMVRTKDSATKDSDVVVAQNTLSHQKVKEASGLFNCGYLYSGSEVTFTDVSDKQKLLAWIKNNGGNVIRFEDTKKTKDGEEQTIGNYEGYRLVFKNGFVRALEDGFTKFEVLSSMGNGGWTQADVKKLMNKIDARRSGMNDSYTQEIAKQIEDLTKEYNTKDENLKEKLIRLAEEAGDKQYADDIKNGKVPLSQSELVRRIGWYTERTVG
jgi:hypothetical protein